MPFLLPILLMFNTKWVPMKGIVTNRHNQWVGCDGQQHSPTITFYCRHVCISVRYDGPGCFFHILLIKYQLDQDNKNLRVLAISAITGSIGWMLSSTMHPDGDQVWHTFIGSSFEIINSLLSPQIWWLHKNFMESFAKTTRKNKGIKTENMKDVNVVPENV